MSNILKGIFNEGSYGDYPFNPDDPRNWAKKIAYDNRIQKKAYADQQKAAILATQPKVTKPKLTLDDVWRKVEYVVGQIFPDGDPIDWLVPWFRKQGIADHKVGDIIERAARKHGYKDLYDYWDSMKDLYGGDLREGVAEGLMWDDTDNRLSVDERMSIIESYYLAKSQLLTEANNQDLTAYFLSLTSMSDKLIKNGEYLMIFLALLNNKIHQLSYPETVTMLAKQGNEYIVKLKGGAIKQFPSKHIRDKLVAATFFFNNSESFDKFRTVMSLKFDMDFAEYSDYVSDQGIREGSYQETEETSVINTFEKLVKQGRDPVDIIAHRFGWGSYELDQLAHNLGFKNSAEWARAAAQGKGVTENVTETTEQSTPNTDEILYYLTSAVRQITKDVGGFYDINFKQRVTSIYDVLRDYLKNDDFEGFGKAYDTFLSKYPDTSTELYDEMFMAAGLGDNATIEDFLNKVSSKGVAEDTDNTLNEIDFASGLADITMPQSEIIDNSSPRKTIGSRQVFLYSNGKNKIYFFKSDTNSIEALLYLSGSRLLAMKNFAKKPGLIYNLFRYVIDIEKQKIILEPIDKLTLEGIKWVTDQMSRSNGLRVTSLDGKKVSPEFLWQEWDQARENGKHGPTGIIIGESQNSQEIVENEERIIPFDIWNARGLSENKIPDYVKNAEFIFKESSNMKKQGVAEGKKTYKLNLEAIENRFGEIKIGNTILNNQPLLNYLCKNDISSDVFYYLIEEKLNKLHPNVVNESVDKIDPELKYIFSQFNNFSTGNQVKVGDMVSVLDLEAFLISQINIELSGFTEPRKIIEVTNNYVRFETNQVFPKRPVIQTKMWRQTIFFHDSDQAKKCVTLMTLLSDDNGNFNFSINVDKDSLKNGMAEDTNSSINDDDHYVVNKNTGKIAAHYGTGFRGESLARSKANELGSDYVVVTGLRYKFRMKGVAESSYADTDDNKPRIRKYKDKFGKTWYEVLDKNGVRVKGQGTSGFDSLENAKELLRHISEGQIYLQGGGGTQSQRWYTPKHVPNQDELDESLRTENPCWKGYHPVGTKKKNGKTVPNCVPVKKESAIMKGLQTEGNDEEHHTGGTLGTPYPGTYEQEMAPVRHKSRTPQKPQSIAF